jgi:uncharacterized protein (UPF0332 family)
MSDDTTHDPPVKPKRNLPRRGRWSAEVAEAPRRATEPARQTAKAGAKPKQRRANPSGVLWSKAIAAARSAEQLLVSGDPDGAANRAYYAAFSGARAALAGVRASLAASKGHATITRRLEKHMVQERGLDSALGRPFFGALGHMRWVADYGDAGVDAAAARAKLGEVLAFLAAVEPFVKKAKP